jgi:hypothetical protein
VNGPFNLRYLPYYLTLLYRVCQACFYFISPFSIFDPGWSIHTALKAAIQSGSARRCPLQAPVKRHPAVADLLPVREPVAATKEETERT